MKNYLISILLFFTTGNILGQTLLRNETVSFDLSITNGDNEFVEMYLTESATLNVEVSWTGSCDRLKLELYGPGQTASYESISGSSPLKFEFAITDLMLAQGKKWKVVVSKPQYGGYAEGEISVKYQKVWVLLPIIELLPTTFNNVVIPIDSPQITPVIAPIYSDDTILNVNVDLEGTIRANYTNGSWTEIGLDGSRLHFDHISGTMSTTMFYSSVPVFSPPQPINAFFGESERQWKTKLDVWLQGIGEYLLNEIHHELEFNQEAITNYTKKENENCQNLYSRLDFRCKFLKNLQLIQPK